MIAVINYGAGNLRSVSNAFNAIGQSCEITDNPNVLKKASAIVLPGVGAFGDGMAELQRMHLIEQLHEEVMVKKKLFLGICLGMQFLAAESHELGLHPGFKWIHGSVRLIKPNDKRCRVPHIGWNNTRIHKRGPLFEGMKEEPIFYFVHSFQFEPAVKESSVIAATCWHGQTVTVAIQKENIFGVQFHPEKSQEDGLKLLRNFVKII